MTRILAAASAAIALSLGSAAISAAGAQMVIPPAGTPARTAWCAINANACRNMYNSNYYGRNVRGVRHDTRDIRSDRRDMVMDRRDLRYDALQYGGRAGVRTDRRDLRHDGRDLRADRRDLRRDYRGH